MDMIENKVIIITQSLQVGKMEWKEATTKLMTIINSQKEVFNSSKKIHGKQIQVNNIEVSTEANA